MALILRNGGSQSPDRWLKEPRNNQSAYIEAFNANVAVWDGSEQTNRFRLETELIAQQARNDIMEAVKLGLHSRAESIKMFYIEFFYDYPFKDKNGRRYCYDGGYTQD